MMRPAYDPVASLFCHPRALLLLSSDPVLGLDPRIHLSWRVAPLLERDASTLHQVKRGGDKVGRKGSNIEAGFACEDEWRLATNRSENSAISQITEAAMLVRDYFVDISRELNSKSESIRQAYKTHNPSAGTSREDLIVRFFRDHLPQRYRVDTGLILAGTGRFSNEADLVIVDRHLNSPLYPTNTKPIWLVESVYALIEVKTTLSKKNFENCLQKCQRFKRLEKKYSDIGSKQHISDSLFIIWSFEGPKPEHLRKLFLQTTKGVDHGEQPDLIIVPNKYVASAGNYLELAVLGQPKSTHRQLIEQQSKRNLEGLLGDGLRIYHINENALLAFFFWLQEWLAAAGDRRATLMNYVPHDFVMGTVK